MASRTNKKSKASKEKGSCASGGRAEVSALILVSRLEKAAMYKAQALEPEGEPFSSPEYPLRVSLGAVVSDALDADARALLSLDQPLRARGVTESHRGYLPWHRERVFQREQEGTP